MPILALASICMSLNIMMLYTCIHGKGHWAARLFWGFIAAFNIIFSGAYFFHSNP